MVYPGFAMEAELGSGDARFLLLIFLRLPPAMWLSLVLPALAIFDWSLFFLCSWLWQNSSESACLCDPVILQSCDPEIWGGLGEKDIAGSGNSRLVCISAVL